MTTTPCREAADPPRERPATPEREAGQSTNNAQRIDSTPAVDGKAQAASEWKYKLPMAVHSSLDDAGLSAEDFRVMAAICRKCGDEANGRQCDSTIRTLGKVCRLHHDTVRKSIARLVELGWVSVIDRPGRTKVHVARFPDPYGFKGGVSSQGRGMVSREGLFFEGGPPSGFKGGHPYGFKGTEGIPLREPKKGNPIVELPFPSEAFKSAWNDWQLHREEIKKKLTPTSIRQQLRNFAEWGEVRSIDAIRYTIGNGWQGLREPDGLRTPISSAPAGTIITGGRAMRS